MFSLLKAGALALLFSSGVSGPAEMRMLVEQELKGHPHKSEIMEVIECESGFDHLTQSWHRDPKGPNGQENSWGLVQINLDYNPNVNLEEALDWRFSVEFIKKHFQQGRKEMWTCWKILNKTAYGR